MTGFARALRRRGIDLAALVVIVVAGLAGPAAARLIADAAHLVVNCTNAAARQLGAHSEPQ